ncbi:MAG TPA: peptidoglycan-associated lipoprotein Pal [Candidatus Limnocylindrales bacterium]|jgi:peptidoglycan-associated lipoprotein|nr:peptidoglycan-associated lipoprotein Pal [Candidatus Limnocylindrales bacterium]
MMRERKPLLSYGLSLLAVTFLISCGQPANPPPPKWTVENSNASAGQASAAAKPAPPKPEVDKDSSLEALRRGEAAGSGPLKDIGFNFDSADLSETARATLKANAEWLKANPSARVQIEGHCDERGTAEYNMALGAKRAQAAMDYLSTLGVAANRLSTISYGEEIPVCKEHNEDCWVKNRRARFVTSAAKSVS